MRGPTTAIILAAGVGRRLGATAEGVPKCMLPIGDRTLLEHQVQALAAVGVEHVVLIVGHQAERVRAHAHALTQVAWTFIDNPRHQDSNTLWSLATAAEHLRSGALVINGDVLFDASLLHRLLDADRVAALSVEVRTCGAEEVKVRVDRNDRVLALSKQVSVQDSLGESVGVSVFGGAWATALADRLLEMAEQEVHRASYYETALAELASDLPLHVVRLDGEPVIEIDFAEDYLHALQHIAPRLRDSTRTT